MCKCIAFKDHSMIGNLNHIAIAVPDLEAVIDQYQTLFGAFVTSPQTLVSHGVRVAIVNLPNTKIKLITPFGESSPLQAFLKNHPQGGFHHLCYEVDDLENARTQLAKAGLQAIGDGVPKPGYDGNSVLFFSPQDCLGVLIALEESPSLKMSERVDIERVSPVHTLPHPSLDSLEGVDGVGIKIEVDFKHPTPKDNEEGE